MAEQNANRTREQAGTVVKRRGMLAAAWAAVATIVAKRTTEPVGATTTDTNFVATGTATNFDARGSATIALDTTHGTFSTGVFAKGTSKGVIGFSDDVALYGQGGNTGLLVGGGTFGAQISGGSTGVQGTGVSQGVGGSITGSTDDSVAVYGYNSSNAAGCIAVRGTIATTAVAGSIGVYAENMSTDTGGAPGAGGYGVYGYSVHGHGVIGGTVGPGGGGIVGSTFGVAGVWAGLFFGPLAVVGGAKSAAVANGDGTHSLLYCVESPESWFEDFGEAMLECGRAEVIIDPAFAAVVDVTNYHVFLTAHNRDHHLAVTARTPTRFCVEADVDLAQLKGKQDGDLTGSFSWRLVAKRKDIAAPRLAKIQLPPTPKHPNPPLPAMAQRPAHVPGSRMERGVSPTV